METNGPYLTEGVVAAILATFAFGVSYFRSQRLTQGRVR